MKRQNEIEYIYNCYPRFQDMDAYGIVHHSKYLCYAEEAKLAFMSDREFFGMQIMDTKDCKFVVRDVAIKYLKPIRYKANEPIRVHLFFYIKDGVRVVFRFEMFYMERKVCAGTTEHLMVNNKGELKFNVPKDINDRYLCLMSKGE